MEREERLRMVIDTNVLIGALVKDNSFKARFLKDRYFQFFFPDYGLLEIEKFRDYICLKREKKSIVPSFDFALTLPRLKSRDSHFIDQNLLRRSMPEQRI